MSVSEHFHGAVAALQPVVHGVPDGALGQATPCADWDVRALVSHLLGTSEAMRRVGIREPLDQQDPWGTDGVDVGEGWRQELGTRMLELANAWAAPDAWEGEALDGAMPRSRIGQMAYAELLLHGWDLAIATGQGVELSEPQVAALWQIMDEHGETGRSMGAFGAQVAVPDDAPDFDRALGAAGRDPDWTP